MRHRFHRQSAGFSLIELLVAMLLIGILAAIAMPAYKDYRIKANRSAAKAVLLDLASRQEQYAVSNRAYATTAAALGVTVPDDVALNYDITFPAATPVTVGTVTMTGFIIRATPRAGTIQANDSTLEINQFGLKTPVDVW